MNYKEKREIIINEIVNSDYKGICEIYRSNNKD